MQREITSKTAASAAAIAALTLLLATLGPTAAGAQDPPPQAHPNVIVVMTDDQNVSQLTPEYMPKTMRLLGGEEGTEFTKSYVSAPLCCPSRAGLLSGQYPHNNGVLDNEPGYPALRNKDETIFSWLHDAGYRTGHIGRFLLNYDRFATEPPDDYTAPLPASPPPPGVDDWFGFKSGFTWYFTAPFSDNGAPLLTANNSAGYSTRVINSQATDFVTQAAPSPQPFFLWVAHLAPHSTNLQPRGDCGGGVPLPEPGTYRPYADEPLPKPPSFGEEKNRDKPTWVESRPPLRKRQIADLTRSWRCALATLTSVDRGVATLLRTLRKTGELDDTAVFFTSDNGYYYGEHRIVLEKIYPYEEAWRVPLLARIPPAYLGGAETPPEVKKNVSNLDLTATILDLADARPCVADGRCATIDGRSFLPLLGAAGPEWPTDRAVLAQIGNRACGIIPKPGSGLKNFYDAIRTRRYMYAEVNRVNPLTGECNRLEFELYDLKSDPDQLRNKAVNPAVKTPSPLQVSLAQRLSALVRCAGAAGRDTPLVDEYTGERPALRVAPPAGLRLVPRIVLAACLLAAATVLASPPTAGAAEPRPNVIVVMTDDQTVAQLKPWVMPATDTFLRRQGASFTNATVSSPLCCPSRAGFLTGSYAHNNGVFDNEPGYPALTPKTSTLFTWLRAAGYRTGHIGRFLLEYPSDPTTLQGTLAPPGVDRWFGYIDQATLYYNALVSDDGFLTRTGADPYAGYTTNVINREANEFVAAAAPSPKPFFLWVAHVAPHTTNAPQRESCGGGTPVPEPGRYPPFATEPLPRPPSFNEKRISDKPHWVRARRRLSPERLDLLRRGWRCALASLTTVDAGVAALITKLAEVGELDDTVLFFTSDNGLAFGEHRLVQAKSYPYEEVLRVPLLARIPPDYLGGATPPREIDAPVTNLDLTATILDLTGTVPCLAVAGCHPIDGRSLMPLLRGGTGSWPKRRGTLVEIGNRNCVRDPSVPNGLDTFYDAIRTPTFLYVVLHHVNTSTGLCDREEYELYNLKRDPFQLDNLAVNPEHRQPSPTQKGLAARLRVLRNCAGIEGRDVALAGRPFCE